MKTPTKNLPAQLLSFAILLAVAMSGPVSLAAPGVPAIFNFAPAAGSNGTIVAISGTNFSSTAASNIVYFGAVRATVLTASPAGLMVTVPPGATYAPMTVTVGGLTAWAEAPFLPTFNGGTSNAITLATRLDLPAGDGPGQAIFADVDGDGKPDLLVTSDAQFISIYRNISTNGALLGEALFAARVDVPIPGNLQAAVLADIDGDGKLDILVLDDNLNQIHILKNWSTPGNITTNAFVLSTSLSTGNNPRGLVVRDLDADGLPDIAVANWADSTVWVFHNLGSTNGITTNSFASPVICAVGAQPQDLKAADLDGDGLPDLVTANNNYGTTNSVSLLRNTSSPGILSFATQVALTGMPTSYMLTIGDLDGDERPDLVVSSFIQGQAVSVYRNTSSPGSLTASSFAARVDFALPGWGNGVAIGDLNGDGKPDLAVVTQLGDGLSIFMNISSPGGFTSNSLAPRVDYPTGWNPNGISIGDLDGDGRPDIEFAASYGATLSIYQNLTPSVAPSAPAPPVITSFVPNVAAPGTNVTITGYNFSPNAASNTVYFGSVMGAVVSASPTNLTVTVPAGAIYAPITVTVNGLTTSAGAAFLPTFAGNGSGINAANFGLGGDLATGNGPNQTVIADLDGDGKPDLIVCNDYGNSISIFRNLSTNGTLTPASFAPRIDLPTTSGTYSPMFVAVADVDGDGKLDIIVTENGDNVVSVYHNDSTPGIINSNSFATRLEFPTGVGCRGLVVKDLDGDGKPDIVTANGGDGTISILRNTCVIGALSSNSFAPRVDIPTGSGCDWVAVADLNGDGKPDIITANGGESTISVLQNAITSPGSITASSFATTIDLAVPSEPLTVVVLDVDGDGQPDLAVTAYLPQTLSVIRNLGVGGNLTTNSFAPRIDFSLDGRGHTIAVGDLGGDGKPDLAVDSELNSLVSLFRNLSTPGSFTNTSLAAQVELATGWNAWGISVGDLDGDGRPDIVFCNTYDSTLQIYQNNTPLGTPPVAPSITTQPTNLTVTVNGTAIFNLAANGTQPLIYQWNFDGTNIVGATNATLTLDHVQPAQAGSYSVLVTNLAGSVASSNAVLTVYVPPLPPTILAQTPNQVVAVSNNAIFSVMAGGTAPLSYFWSRNGAQIPNATNSTYILFNAQLSDSGSEFSCLVTNAYGTADSSNVLLKVIQTVANGLCNGATVITNSSYTNTQSTLKADAPGNPALDCVTGFGHAVWYEFTAPLAGLLIVDTFGSDYDTGLGLYTGSCDALTEVACNDDAGGGVTSQVILPTTAGTTYYILAGGYDSDAGNLVLHLNHFTPPAFDVQPTNLFVIVSSNAIFSPTVSGSLPMGFQWYFNNAPMVDGGRISGSMNSALTIANVQTNDGGNYQLVASNMVGVTTSSVAVLTPIILPPTFLHPPVSQSVGAGSNANFFAVVNGTPPYNYQWSFNGNPLADDGMHIAGSTTSSLNISNLTTADAGSYSLTVMNLSGSTNAAATLTVLTPLIFTLQPVGRSVPPGLPTSFIASASGIPAPGYQWQLNGTNLPGATSGSYTNAGIGTNDLGFYQLVASNTMGVVVSTAAQLTFGPVAAWGLNSSGECLPPPGLSNVISVAGASGGSFAVRANGTVVSWGAGSVTNVPASASNVVALASDGNTGCAAVRADGTVAAWGGYVPPALSNVVSVAVGLYNSFALRSEGSVVGWGSGNYPLPAGLNHIAGISAGPAFGLAVRNDSTITTWGGGPATNVPARLANVTAVAAGTTYGLALKSDGTVVAWGSGTGTNLPPGLTNIAAIYASSYPQTPNLCLAVRSNGTVVPWGDNYFGQTNPPAALTNLFAAAGAAAPYHGLALVNNGSPQILLPPVGLTAYAGRNVTLQARVAGAAPLSYQWLLNGTNIPGATNTSLLISNIQLAHAGNYQVSASNSINTALSLPAPVNVLSNNTLIFLSQSSVSASNVYQGGQATFYSGTVLGNGPLNYQWFFSPTNQNYTAVASATNDTLALNPALAVQSGNYYIAVSNQVAGITSAPVALRVMFAKAWGYLATDPPFVLTNAAAIAVGNYGLGNSSGDYLALSSAGKISSWSGGPVLDGETNFSALGNSIVTAIAAGYEDTLALKSDGTVFAAGYSSYGATNVPATANGITSIACGDYHDLALNYQGAVIGWGQNTFLQVSQATNAAVTNVVAIAAGGQDSIALRADGSVVTWGNYGGLQYPSGGNYPVPQSATNIVAVAAGGTHFLALRANGTVVGWGSNPYGQATIPASWTNIVAISAGTSHSTALRNDGTVVTLGNTYAGYFSNNVPSDLTNVIAIASSGDHDLGLFGTRAPAFTVQPWSRTIFNTATSVWFSSKCAGVQPVRYQWRLNGTNISGATNDTLTINATVTNILGRPVPLPLQSGIYQLIASNAYGVVASHYAQLTVLIPLGVALNATNLNWTTTSDGLWFGETNYTHDGVSAAQSGDIGPFQDTILQTTIATNVAGACTFWWKVSSEPDFDFLEFRVNGIVQAGISGEMDWQQASFPIPAGTNVLLWRYSKNSIYSSGLDAGWVDQFAFVPSPVITSQPLSRTNYAGTTASFSVSANDGQGQAPLTYQWQKNGVNLVNGGNVAGATNYTLTLNNVQDADAASYTVIITGAGASVTSSPAMLAVLDGPPVLVSQPANAATLVGKQASFAVTASGSLPLNYQWRFNGTNLVGNTNSILTVVNARTANAGFYQVVITNYYGSVTSSVATLTLLRSVVVAWGDNSFGQTNVPAGLTAVAVAGGLDHSLALRADGTVAAWGWDNDGQTDVPAGLANVTAIAGGAYHSLALQSNGMVAAWGNNADGETNVPAGLTNVAAIAAGWFHNLALQANGTVVGWGYNGDGEISMPAGLTNVVAIAAGAHHSLALQANGAVVAWGWDPYGQTNVPANLTNVVAIGASAYDSLALQANGTVVVWGASVYGATDVPAGLTNVLAIAAGGFHNLTLQSNGEVVAWGWDNSGQTNVPPDLINAVVIAGGGYHSLAIENDGFPYIVRQPVSQMVASNTTVQFTVAALGAPALNYQWQENGANLSDGFKVTGSATATLTLSNVQTADMASYSVVITNVIGSVTSSPAMLGIFGPPIILLQPASQTVNYGANVQFSVVAIGYPPPAYQWCQNGTNPLGANNPALTLTGVGRSQDGTYTVLVTNIMGGISSSNVALKVLVPQMLGKPSLLPNGLLQFTSCDIGGGTLSPSDLPNFEAQASSNLVHWVTLPNALSLTNGLLLLQDSMQTNLPARFYRILEQ